MPRYNLSNGWTSASLVPNASVASKSADNNAVQTQTASGVGTSTNTGLPGAKPADIKAGIPADFRKAALGTNGTGGVISASAYQYPNPPAYLADAVRNLNSSQGVAQSNLTNTLLQQILNAQINGQQVHPDVVDAHSKAQKAADTAKVAQARAEAAENARQMSYLSNNATIIGSQAQQPAMRPMSPMGGWVGGF